MPEHTDVLLTTGVGEYLEAIYKLTDDESPVPLPTLSDHLGVSAASANEMVRKLSDRGLAHYEPYKGASLTEEGRRQALSVIRRHRLWERLLTDFLEMPWDEVHEEACRLEHATSAALEARLSRFLDAPSSCPHGHTMPGADGTLEQPEMVPLSTLTPGGQAVVIEVPEEDAALLRYLDELNLRPSRVITLLGVEPFNGPLRLRIDDRDCILGRNLADRISVQILETADE